LRFDTGERVVVEDAVNPHYVETSHLVFVRGDRLFGASFDLEALELRAIPPPITMLLPMADSSRFKKRMPCLRRRRSISV
jgi:hypothetical protein